MEWSILDPAALLDDVETARRQDQLLAIPWQQLESNVMTDIGWREGIVDFFK